MKRLLVAGGLAVAFLFAAGEARAQGTGTVRGKVLDEKGAPLEGALMTMEFQGGVTRKMTTKTNKKGEFTQVGLPPGIYRFTATKEGYADAFVEAKISLGEPTYLPDIKLATKAAAQAAAADKSVDELRGNFEKANALMNDGKLDEAEAAYRDAIAADPSNGNYNKLGVELLKWGRLDRAAEAFQQAIDADRNVAEPYFHLGQVYERQGETDRAADQYRAYLTIAAPGESLRSEATDALKRLGR